MEQSLAQALNEFLTPLEEDRVTLNDFLVRYPEHATDVRALLELAEQIQRTPHPFPSPAASAAGKRQMLKALAEKKRSQAISPSLLSRCAAWIANLAGRGERPVARRYALALRLALVAVPMFLLLAIAVKSWGGANVIQAATLGGVNGLVDILPTGSGTWQPAVAGTRVETGDRVRTGPLSAATLIFFDGSATDMKAETEVTVTQMNSRRNGGSKVIVLHQWLGQTHNRVQQLLDPASRFEIETPTAVMAVRGTEFTLDVEPDGTTNIVVIEGTVDVMAQEVTVAVQAGQATVTQPKQTPAPVRPVSIFAPTPEPTPTPQPPGQTKTPQPPGQTKTPQPPGQTGTPQPPGQTKTPQPPGQTKTPQPPGQTKTPQPPGQTKTPQPPGQTKTPQPPGQTKPTKPPKPPKPPKPKK
jgi:ferric-dicitrate binding protein FerR (iron transport regulator)